MSPGKPRVPHCEERQEPHTPGGTGYVLWVGGEPGKTATINGTVPLKPLYKGQVGVSGACAGSTTFASRSLTTHNLAVHKQSLEDQFAQINKDLEKVEGRGDGTHDDAVAGKPICEGFIGGFADVSKELACAMPCSNRRRVILGSRIPSRNSLVCSTNGRSFFLVDTAASVDVGTLRRHHGFCV